MTPFTAGASLSLVGVAGTVTSSIGSIGSLVDSFKELSPKYIEKSKKEEKYLMEELYDIENLIGMLLNALNSNGKNDNAYQLRIK